MSTVVVIGQHYWGSGPDLAKAKATFRQQRGRLSNGYVILTFDDDTEFCGVDDMGRYFWKGNPPTEKVISPRAKR